MQKNKLFILIGVLLFGSIWGMLEATLGAFLHIIHFMLKGPVMFSIAAFLMVTALKIYKPKNKFIFLLGMGIIAALLKSIDFLFLNINVMVIRPMIAIIIESIAFYAAVKVTDKVKLPDIIKVPSIAIPYAYINYIALIVIFGYLNLGSQFWIGKSFADYMVILLADGTKAALIVIAVLLIGKFVITAMEKERNYLLKSRAIYPVSFAFILLCWLIGILAGFT